MTEYENYKNDLIRRMSEDDDIRIFLEKNGLDINVLNMNFSIFADYYSAKERCKDCKGLYMCSQKRAGERYQISYDGILMNSIEYCDYRLAKKKKDDHISSFAYSDIPDDLSSVNMLNIKADDISHMTLYKLCHDILTGKDNTGLYIYGDMGVGKTYMCIALANSLADAGRKTAFVKCNAFVNEMRRLVINDQHLYEENIKALKNADVLIMDDIGSETVSSFSRDDLLLNILDHRMENHLTTIFTSNMSKEDLLKHYAFEKNERTMLLNARRLMERIDILSKDYVLKGNNLRRSHYDK